MFAVDRYVCLFIYELFLYNDVCTAHTHALNIIICSQCRLGNDFRKHVFVSFLR